LATHQDIQYKLREEMPGVIVKESSFTLADLDSFAHLNNFVKEPLRLYSPGEMPFYGLLCDPMFI
jgi:cytochrome P450